MPPARWRATFPLKVLLMMVRAPPLQMAPPTSALLLLTVELMRIRVLLGQL